MINKKEIIWREILYQSLEKKVYRFTQKDLADKVGVHLSFLGDIERGKKGCSIDVAYRISHVLNVNISQFFADEEIPEDVMDFVLFVKENSDKTLADIMKILTRYR